jgi:glycosyltransferase involved in cell wall biosynthesis
VRVAHLVGGGDVAGGQVVALQLATGAHEAGHDVLFVSPTEGEFLELARTAGFPTEVADVQRTTRLAGALRLARLLRRRRVDLLHTHVHVAANVLGRLAARSGRTAVVSHLHIENHFRAARLARAPLVLLDNATARLCARLVAVSDATRRAFERQGFPARLLETVHNGVDVAALVKAPRSRLREDLQIPADRVVLAHVGPLAPVKGQREVLEALAGLSTDGVLVVFFGRDLERGGAYRRELEQLADELGLGDAVHFAGFRPDAAAALREVDALVLPSRIEGLPLAVLEAMAHAKPVVATAVGGTPEAVLDGETGLLVPPRDVPALTAALQALLEDQDLRGRLGDAGRRRVEAHFQATAMTERILQLYDEIARDR